MTDQKREGPFGLDMDFDEAVTPLCGNGEG